LWEVIKKELTFGELSVGLQIVNENKDKDVKLYQLLREQLPIYGIDKDKGERRKVKGKRIFTV
ncbi:unnamed protein product, partial [marine sediment metagenome]